MPEAPLTGPLDEDGTSKYAPQFLQPTDKIEQYAIPCYLGT